MPYLLLPRRIEQLIHGRLARTQKMSLFKYIDRVKTIHKLIEAERTGTSDEFAARVHISRSLLMEHLRELREVYNAPINYCRKRQTFYYSSTFRFKVEISGGMEMIKGGRGWLFTCCEPANPGRNFLF
jgi:hypothetical protein